MILSLFSSLLLFLTFVRFLFLLLFFLLFLFGLCRLFLFFFFFRFCRHSVGFLFFFFFGLFFCLFLVSGSPHGTQVSKLAGNPLANLAALGLGGLTGGGGGGGVNPSGMQMRASFDRRICPLAVGLGNETATCQKQKKRKGPLVATL